MRVGAIAVYGSRAVEDGAPCRLLFRAQTNGRDAEALTTTERRVPAAAAVVAAAAAANAAAAAKAAAAAQQKQQHQQQQLAVGSPKPSDTFKLTVLLAEGERNAVVGGHLCVSARDEGAPAVPFWLAGSCRQVNAQPA